MSGDKPSSDSVVNREQARSPSKKPGRFLSYDEMIDGEEQMLSWTMMSSGYRFRKPRKTLIWFNVF